MKSGAVGIDGDALGCREARVVDGNLAAVQFASVARHGQCRRLALQLVGIHGDVHREGIAKIGYAVEAHIGYACVAMDGGVAHRHGVDGKCQRCRGSKGGGASVVDAVGGDHQSPYVAVVVALGDARHQLSDVGRRFAEVELGAFGVDFRAEADALHVIVARQVVGQAVELLLIVSVIECRIGAIVERLAIVLCDDDDGLLLAARLTFDQRGKEQEDDGCHRQGAQHRKRYGQRPRQGLLGLAATAQPVERDGVGYAQQQAQNDEIPRIVYNE